MNIIKYRMDPNNIPLNALITGAEKLWQNTIPCKSTPGPLRDKFDYRFDMPNLNPQQNLQGVCGQDPFIFVIDCPQEEVELWLQLCSYFFEGTNTLFVLDGCPASKDVKGRTGQLVSFGFSNHHAGIRVWIPTSRSPALKNPSSKMWLLLFCFTIRRPKPQKPSLKTTPAHFVLKSTRN